MTIEKLNKNSIALKPIMISVTVLTAPFNSDSLHAKIPILDVMLHAIPSDRGESGYSGHPSALAAPLEHFPHLGHDKDGGRETDQVNPVKKVERFRLENPLKER